MGVKDPTVLAIDGNRDNLITLQAVLRDALPRATILTASNGPQGLKLAGIDDPDVILLDIVMPGMDGVAVCRKLKASEQLKSIPVIFLTTRKTDKGSRIEALEAGAEGFITKPLDEIELVAQIHAMTKIKAANQLQRRGKEAPTAPVTARTRELKKELSERALRESEERYRGLYNSIRDAILVADTHRNIIDCNAAFTSLFGYTQDEILGQQTLAVYENEANHAALGKALQVHYGDHPFLMTVNYKKKTGEIFSGETGVFYLKNDQGQVTGFIGLIRDVTTRQKVQQSLQESEEKFKKTFYTSPDSININRLEDGMYISINHGFTLIMGYSEADVIGKTSVEINIWGNPEDRNTLVAGLKKSGEVQNLEAKFRRKDASFVYGLMSATVIDLQGVPHILSITRDISERKQNEQALQESEERLRSLYENVTLGLYRTTPDGQVLLANPSLVHMLGYSSAEELRHRNLNQEDFEAGYSRSEFMERIEREGQIAGLESTWKCRDGRVIYIRESARVSRDEEGRVQYYEGTVEDITEYKRAEQRLRQAEQRYRALFEEAPVMYVLTRNVKGTPVIADCNQLFWHTLGYDHDELVGRSLADLYTPTSHAELHEHGGYQSALNDTFTVQERELLTRDGHVIFCLLQAMPEVDATGQVYGTRAMFVDITERKRLSTELASERDKFNFILNELPIGVAVTDANHRIIYINPAATQIDGHLLKPQSLLGQQVIDIHPISERKNVDKRLNDLVSGHKTTVTNQAKRGKRTVEVSYHVRRNQQGDFLGMVRLVSDVSERVLAEQKLQKYATQLETLGTVTAALSTSLDVDNVLKLILNQIAQVLPFDRGALFLYETDEVRVAIDIGITPSIKGQLFSNENELFKEIQQTGKPLVLNHVKDDPRFRNWDHSGKIASWMGIPLLIRDTLIGILTLDSSHFDAYPPEQTQIILSFAAQAAQAIENARQFSIAQHRMDRLTALRKIDQAITDDLDLNLTLSELLKHLQAQLEVDAAVVLLYDNTLQTLSYAQSQGFRTPALQHTNLNLDQGLAGKAALLEHPVFIADLSESKVDITDSPRLKEEDFVSYYGIPLIAKGSLVGVLEIFHRSTLNPNNEWIDFLQALAGQAAIAIDNIQLFEGLEHSNSDLSKAYDATIEGWSRAMDLRDKETVGHSFRVTEMTARLSKAMGISQAERVHMRRGALLHDMGKMAVPDKILFKPGALTKEEWHVMSQHPQFAKDMLSPIAYLQPALDIPYSHHEKWDGSGYPQGLKAKQIPLAARIFAITDVYDALTSDRPYRKAWPIEKVLKHIREQSGKHFDPDVVDAFLQITGNSVTQA
ncbi:MAG TPA: PAS domain S-box protein [Gammaproteobacteria bacterium]|nr:PAS domain S-box protein [Gammaproteobacteria bacterium]